MMTPIVAANQPEWCTVQNLVVARDGIVLLVEILNDLSGGRGF